MVVGAGETVAVELTEARSFVQPAKSIAKTIESKKVFICLSGRIFAQNHSFLCR